MDLWVQIIIYTGPGKATRNSLTTYTDVMIAILERIPPNLNGMVSDASSKMLSPISSFYSTLAQLPMPLPPEAMASNRLLLHTAPIRSARSQEHAHLHSISSKP